MSSLLLLVLPPNPWGHGHTNWFRTFDLKKTKAINKYIFLQFCLSMYIFKFFSSEWQRYCVHTANQQVFFFHILKYVLLVDNICLSFWFSIKLKFTNSYLKDKSSDCPNMHKIFVETWHLPLKPLPYTYIKSKWM